MQLTRCVVAVLILLGFAGSASTEPDPNYVYIVSPCRWVDTRNGACVPGFGSANASGLRCSVGPIRSGEVRVYGAQCVAECPAGSGQHPIPMWATGLIVNVTVTGATGAGYLTLFPPSERRPRLETLTFKAGETKSTLAIVRLGNGMFPDIPLTIEKDSSIACENVSGEYFPDFGVYALVSGRGGTVHVILDIVGYTRAF